MARFEVSDFHENAIEQLTPSEQREIRKKVVEAGAKVVEKELKSAIEARHHVVTGDMRDSVGMGDVHEDLGSTWVDVYPQGVDRRGVSNFTKLRRIVNGRTNMLGQSTQRRDNFLTKTRKQMEPRVLAVMEAAYDLAMKDLMK